LRFEIDAIWRRWRLKFVSFKNIQNIRLFSYSGSVLQVLHFLPHLFREIFTSTEALFIFWFKFEYETNLVSSFAKTENPEKKSFRIALHETHWKTYLMHCLNGQCHHHPLRRNVITALTSYLLQIKDSAVARQGRKGRLPLPRKLSIILIWEMKDY